MINEIFKFKHKSCRADIVEKRDYFLLLMINSTVPYNGHGTEMIKILRTFCDAHYKPLKSSPALTPAGMYFLMKNNIEQVEDFIVIS